MKEFKTTDILLAACLKVFGHSLDRIEINGTKGTFVFYDADEKVIKDFDLGKLKVEPVSFNTAIKQLTTSVRRMTQDK